MKKENKIALLITELLADRNLHDNYIDYEIDKFSTPIYEYVIYRLHFDNLITSNQFYLLNKLKLNYYVSYNNFNKKLMINIDIK